MLQGGKDLAGRELVGEGRLKAFVARDPMEEGTEEATLDEVVQFRWGGQGLRAVTNECTETEVVAVLMIIGGQSLVGELTGAVADKNTRLMDDARVGGEHDGPKSFIAFSKTVLNNGGKKRAGREHLRGLEELRDIQGP